MHEWALADAVVAAAVRRPAGGDSRPVTVLVGELQAIDREIFEFALASLAAEAGLAPGSFVLRTQPAEFRCRACGRRWGLGAESGLTDEQREAIHFLPESAHAFVRCPGCGGVDFGVEQGRGVTIAENPRGDGGPDEGGRGDGP
jgi:hydrogenase nickel incorporation protein HypA/HybF